MKIKYKMPEKKASFRLEAKQVEKDGIKLATLRTHFPSLEKAMKEGDQMILHAKQVKIVELQDGIWLGGKVYRRSKSQPWIEVRA